MTKSPIYWYFSDFLKGTSLVRSYRLVESLKTKTPEEIREFQNERLKELVKHAYFHTRYYRRLFDNLNLKPHDIQSSADLVKIPILTKDLIRNNLQDLTADNVSKRYVQTRSTGGTSGEPLVYKSDISSWSLHWVLKFVAWEEAGYKPGMPVGLVGGASIIPNRKPTQIRKIWNKLNHFYLLPASHMNDEIMSHYANIINTQRVRFIRGYPSSIALFARFCQSHGIKLSINGVMTTAEVLRDEYKESIKQAFACRIIDTYGCADGGANANTCRFDTGMHVSMMASIWEVCDKSGNQVVENELGELTTTNLTNYAMPTLRYQPGDLVKNRLDYTPCKCGNSMPRIERIFGRSTDILSFSNGTSLAGPALTLLFREFSIVNYQVIQDSTSSLSVKIVPGYDFDQASIKRLHEILTHHCGSDVQIIVSLVDDIPVPISGKHRFVINNIR